MADSGNHTIRKISPAGVVTTLAGTAGVYGSSDGTGPAAQFGGESYGDGGPEGVAVDASGSVYVADTYNFNIRKITSAGVVTTLAGSSIGFADNEDGTGGSALFSTVCGIAADANGNVYVADTGNHTIRKGSPPILPAILALTAPSNVTATSVQLNGTINALYNATTAVFQYSTNINFTPGLTTSIATTPATITGANNTPVSAMLTGLTDGTTYYYRIVATNSLGTTKSNVGNFIPFSPPLPTSEAPPP